MSNTKKTKDYMNLALSLGICLAAFAVLFMVFPVLKSSDLISMKTKAFNAYRADSWIPMILSFAWYAVWQIKTTRTKTIVSPKEYKKSKSFFTALSVICCVFSEVVIAFLTTAFPKAIIAVVISLVIYILVTFVIYRFFGAK